MKRQVKAIQASTASKADKRLVQKILDEIKQLDTDLENLYMQNEEVYDAIDVSSLEDELKGADMFISHAINSL